MEVSKLFPLRKKHNLNPTQFYVLCYFSQENEDFNKPNSKIASELELSDTVFRTSLYTLRDKGLVQVNFSKTGDRFINDVREVDFQSIKSNGTLKNDEVKSSELPKSEVFTHTKETTIGNQKLKSVNSKNPLKNLPSTKEKSKKSPPKKDEKPKVFKRDSQKKASAAIKMDNSNLDKQVQIVLKRFILCYNELYKKYDFKGLLKLKEVLSSPFYSKLVQTALKKAGLEMLEKIIKHKYNILLNSKDIFTHFWSYFTPNTLFARNLEKNIQIVVGSVQDGWGIATSFRKKEKAIDSQTLYVTGKEIYGDDVDLVKMGIELDEEEVINGYL